MLKLVTIALAVWLLAGSALAGDGFARGDAPQKRAKTLASFSLVGADLAVTAKGRRAAAVTADRYAEMRKEAAMAKAFGGEPPAYVTFDVSLSF
ncbi:MAG: hypothetical protein GC153_04945 [Alphaproteobacteria bacterium]|nr:hypothetical protein [Alphaproteobacteria bacterium]